MSTADRMDPLDAARRSIYRHFPDCLAAFAAGSFLRGEDTATSDIDLVIITMRAEAPYRTAFVEHGWPLEAFVHTPESYRWYFASDAAQRIPSLIDMCASGEVLRDRDGLAERIRREARALLESGPEGLNEDEIAGLRYALTDALDDLSGCTDRAEGVLIACSVAQEATDLLLGLNRRWLGRGKWLLRALRRYDPEQATRLAEAMERQAQYGDALPLVRFATDVLEIAGGRLFEGYYSQGKREPPG